MHAALVTISIDPEQAPAAAAALMDDILPRVTSAPGFTAGYWLGQIRTPVLYLQGGQDRIVPSSRAGWLASHTPSAELWLRPGDGHVSVLGAAEAAMGWIREQAQQS